MDENFCNSMAHDVDKMRLKEVYLHQNQVDDEVFDIFHIYELSTETTGLPVKPAITTNCAVSEVFNRALQIMHDNDGDSGDMGNGHDSESNIGRNNANRSPTNIAGTTIKTERLMSPLPGGSAVNPDKFRILSTATGKLECDESMETEQVGGVADPLPVATHNGVTPTSPLQITNIFSSFNFEDDIALMMTSDPQSIVECKTVTSTSEDLQTDSANETPLGDSRMASDTDNLTATSHPTVVDEDHPLLDQLLGENLQSDSEAMDVNEFNNGNEAAISSNTEPIAATMASDIDPPECDIEAAKLACLGRKREFKRHVRPYDWNWDHSYHIGLESDDENDHEGAFRSSSSKRPSLAIVPENIAKKPAPILIRRSTICATASRSTAHKPVDALLSHRMMTDFMARTIPPSKTKTSSNGMPVIHSVMSITSFTPAKPAGVNASMAPVTPSTKRNDVTSSEQNKSLSMRANKLSVFKSVVSLPSPIEHPLISAINSSACRKEPTATKILQNHRQSPGKQPNTWPPSVVSLKATDDNQTSMSASTSQKHPQIIRIPKKKHENATTPAEQNNSNAPMESIICQSCMTIFDSADTFNFHKCSKGLPKPMRVIFKCKNCDEKFESRDTLVKHCDLTAHRGVMRMEKMPISTPFRTYPGKRKPSIRVRKLSSMQMMPPAFSTKLSSALSAISSDTTVVMPNTYSDTAEVETAAVETAAADDQSTVHACTECDRVYKTSSKLCKHMQSHVHVLKGQFPPRVISTLNRDGVEVMRYMCTICGLSFPTELLHMHHGYVHKKYRCQWCSYSVNSSKDLERHSAIAHAELASGFKT